MTKMILVEAVTRRWPSKKIIVLKEIEAGAALENCRALINQIIAGLSGEEPFVDVSSAAKFLFHLECAGSALKKSVPRPRELH